MWNYVCKQFYKTCSYYSGAFIQNDVRLRKQHATGTWLSGSFGQISAGWESLWFLIVHVNFRNGAWVKTKKPFSTGLRRPIKSGETYSGRGSRSQGRSLQNEYILRVPGHRQSPAGLWNCRQGREKLAGLYTFDETWAFRNCILRVISVSLFI